jgi:hypothetical protein
MTDNVAVLPTPPQTPPQVPSQPTTDAERIDAIKTFLFQGCLKQYQDLSASITRLSVNDNLKRIIIEKLDDAWLWVKEAFQVLQIELPQPPKVIDMPSKGKKGAKKKKRK